MADVSFKVTFDYLAPFGNAHLILVDVDIEVIHGSHF